MQDSPLIDRFAEDTNRSEWLDHVYVATDPTSIAKTCADYRPRVTLIDPDDPSPLGDPAPTPPRNCRLSDGPSRATATARELHPPGPDESRPDAEGAGR